MQDRAAAETARSNKRFSPVMPLDRPSGTKASESAFQVYHAKKRRSSEGRSNEGSPCLAETTPRQGAEKVMKWGKTQEKWKDMLRLWS